LAGVTFACFAAMAGGIDAATRTAASTTVAVDLFNITRPLPDPFPKTN
jgi:hypothetical protein